MKSKIMDIVVYLLIPMIILIVTLRIALILSFVKEFGPVGDIDWISNLVIVEALTEFIIGTLFIYKDNLR